MSKEISLSIEETNKIRIAAGLPPLAAPKAIAKSINNDKKIDDNNNDNTAAANEWREHFYKKKRDRLLKGGSESSNKHSIGSKYAKKYSSTAEWIQAHKAKSSNNTVKKQKKKKKKVIDSSNNEYGSDDIKGMKVSHDFDIFGNSDSVILTLKDTNVLEDDGEDELENANLRTQASGSDDDDDANDDNYHDIFNNNKLEEESKQPSYWRLGDDINMNDSAANNSESKNLSAVSLDTKNVIASDYLTASEEKERKKKKKKKKSKHNESSKRTFDMFMDESNDNQMMHLGSRDASLHKKRALEEKISEQKQRDANYLRALEKSRKSTAAMLAQYNNNNSNGNNDSNSNNDNNNIKSEE